MSITDSLHTALPVGAVFVASTALTGYLQLAAYVVTITYTLFKFYAEYRAYKDKKNE